MIWQYYVILCTSTIKNSLENKPESYFSLKHRIVSNVVYYLSVSDAHLDCK